MKGNLKTLHDGCGVICLRNLSTQGMISKNLLLTKDRTENGIPQFTLLFLQFINIDPESARKTVQILLFYLKSLDRATISTKKYLSELPSNSLLYL